MPARETVGVAAPRGLEVQLRRALAPMVAQITRAAATIRTPADARGLGPALRRAWPTKRLARIVRGVMAEVPGRSAAGWRKWERRAAKVRARRDAADDGEALVDRWSREATARIASVRDEVAERLRRDVVQAIERGTDPADLAKQWVREGVPVEFGTVEGRLKTIAQHQIANLHAAIQAERARAIGVDEFDWMTQDDDKVRPAHRALHGRRFRYSDPPSEGLPGQPINCRCFARAVIPDELVAEFEVGAVFDT